jgi:DNA modification methylase
VNQQADFFVAPDGEVGRLLDKANRQPEGAFLRQTEKEKRVNYEEFLEGKKFRQVAYGKTVDPADIHPKLFPFQRDVTAWAVRKGRCAIFLDTGLGKTFCQLEWARLMGENTLIVAPLSVARQTVREARKIDIDVYYVRSQEQVDAGGKLWITNYEMIDAFDFSQFGAVVLDESSILKSIGSKTRRKLIRLCADVPYRLCCTATPAPNDYVELGNHAEFLGICSRAEMLAMFFINANKEHTFYVDDKAYRKKGTNKAGQEWRLKHHAEQPFFRWLASWAIVMTKPSDLGYDDDGFILPPLNVETHFVDGDYKSDDRLFFTHIRGVREHAKIRKATVPQRLEKLIELIDSEGDEQWIVWCGLNEESEAATRALSGAVEVRGDDTIDDKAQAFEDFQDGKFRILVTKGKIGGHGMNFQNAHKMAFFGLSHSFEQYYQCVRREWRYLQEHPVDVHIILSSYEDGVYHNVMRKDAQARRLREEMVKQLERFEREELGMVVPLSAEYQERTVEQPQWTAMLGDAAERMKELEDDSIDLSIYSPPFADLYTYTSSPRDLGNSRGWDEFFEHYQYIIRDVLRVTKPGRLTCVHTSDIPALQQNDGYIGIKDFPGRVIEAYAREGWIFHGRVVISKNPQAQAIRTHSKALLFVQMEKDSSWSRPALLDQVLIFRKEGDNAVPVTPVENGEMDRNTWIEWAHGIWTDINETDVLQHGYKHGRAHDDEKHICPLQLPTIERCVKLYSNPGETVLSPFGGIGSEGYVAVRLGRKAVLIELKESYFQEMLKNMHAAESKGDDMFAWAGVEVERTNLPTST